MTAELSDSVQENLPSIIKGLAANIHGRVDAIPSSVTAGSPASIAAVAERLGVDEGAARSILEGAAESADEELSAAARKILRV